MRGAPACGLAYSICRADWLVYRACGEDVRSACTQACKWTWLAHERRWSADLFRQLGLEDLFQGERLGRRIADVGDKAGETTARADASLRGMACGLSLNRTPEELARRYLAAIQALGYGTRHIIETMNNAGYAIAKIRLCGGGAKNPLLIQEHADITGCETTVSPEPDAPLLGSAMLAAAAADCHADVFTAMRAMTRPGKVFAPRTQTRSFHDRKYRVFLEMHDDQIKYRRMMAADRRSDQ